MLLLLSVEEDGEVKRSNNASLAMGEEGAGAGKSAVQEEAAAMTAFSMVRRQRWRTVAAASNRGDDAGGGVAESDRNLYGRIVN